MRTRRQHGGGDRQVPANYSRSGSFSWNVRMGRYMATSENAVSYCTRYFMFSRASAKCNLTFCGFNFRCECYDYLFDIVIKMKSLGVQAKGTIWSAKGDFNLGEWVVSILFNYIYGINNGYHIHMCCSAVEWHYWRRVWVRNQVIWRKSILLQLGYCNMLLIVKEFNVEYYIRIDFTVCILSWCMRAVSTVPILQNSCSSSSITYIIRSMNADNNFR